MTKIQTLAQNPLIDNPLINGAIGKVYSTKATDPDLLFINLLGQIVFVLISFVGIVFIILIIYGGYLWMNAKGNESEVEKAQHIIRDAVIGLMVLSGAASIWYLIDAFLINRPPI